MLPGSKQPPVFTTVARRLNGCCDTMAAMQQLGSGWTTAVRHELLLR